MRNQELVTVEKFQLVSRWDGVPEDELAEIMEDLNGLSGDGAAIELKRITIPSGTSKSFIVETDDPDSPDTIKAVEGIILFNHHVNAYWDTAFGETDNKTPTCSSIDGNLGVRTDDGEVCECKDCPLNQYAKLDEGWQRKQCRNTLRVYLVVSGKPFIYVLSVPPTSLKEVSDGLKQAVKIAKKPLSRIVVRFTLYGAKSKKGADYNKVKVETVGFAPANFVGKAKSIRSEIMAAYQNWGVSSDDYNVVDDANRPAAALPESQTRSEPASVERSETAFASAPPVQNVIWQNVESADELF